MYQYSFIQWLCVFYFYSFVGWIVESSYVSLRKRRFVNRGFMKGPFIPLYGTGATIMLLVSIPFKDNLLAVYVAGCVACTILEYVTGVLMESIFKVRYWDYSELKFNFQGHICLGTTLSWGVLTLILTQFLHVLVDEYIISVLHNDILTVIAFVVTAIVFSDFAVAFKNAIDFRNVLDKLVAAKKEFAIVQDKLDSIVMFAEERREDIAHLRSDLVENLRYYKNESESKVRFLTSQVKNKARNLYENNPSFHYIEAYKDAVKDLFDDTEEDKDTKGN